MLNLAELDTAELSSLTKAMHEARFPEVWDDPIVWLSPFVIDLHDEAIKETRRRYVARGANSSVASLDQWVQWRGRPERAVVVARLTEDEHFRRTVLDEGTSYLRWALRPFVLDDESAADLLSCATRLAHGVDEVTS